MALRNKVHEDAKDMREIIGKRIRDERSRLNLTQAELANKIAAKAGTCSRQAVAQWEGAVASPSYSLMPIVAQALEVSAGFLAFGEKAPDLSKPHITKSAIPTSVQMMPEVAFGETPASGKATRQWGVPKEYLSEITGGADAKDVFITILERSEVKEVPEGTRVYVNAGDLRPDGTPMLVMADGSATVRNVMPVFGDPEKVRVFDAKGKEEVVDVSSVQFLGKVLRAY